MTRAWTQSKLERTLRYWQERLRLMDWKVTIAFARKDKFDDCQAHVEWNINSRCASILVIDPRDFTPTLDEPQDIENSVCHELVHLHLAHWDTKNNAAEIQQEQAIESLTEALVSLKRREK